MAVVAAGGLRVPGVELLGELFEEQDASAAGAGLDDFAMEDEVRDLRESAVPGAVRLDFELRGLHGEIVELPAAWCQLPPLGGRGAIFGRHPLEIRIRRPFRGVFCGRGSC